MKRDIIEIAIGSVTVIFAFCFWLFVKNAIVVSTASTWLGPIVVASFFLVFLCLSILLFRRMIFLEIVLLLSLATSAFFAFNWLQFVVIALGHIFMFIAARKIRNDMELNIKISPVKSLQAGKTYLIFAISIVVCMQYFLIIRGFEGEKKVPYFDAGFVTKKIAIPFLSSVSPQFKALENEKLTVDEFVLQSQSQMAKDGLTQEEEKMLDEQLPEKMTVAQKEIIKKQARENFSNTQAQITEKNKVLILEAGRRQFSDMVGTKVTGNEKIGDVFTGLINNRVNGYFNPKVGDGQSNSTLPMILAIVLFLIVFPLAVLLCTFLFWITGFVLYVLIKSKVLEVKSVMISKEVLQ
ncbi:MAG: hypothetical protein WCI36_03550 [bacterium]